MKSRFRGLRPSPAMVVACVALLVALAGTSVAAVTIVIPRNSVGALQLKANSVNSLKVRNGSLLKADFAPGQVPAGKTGSAGPAGPAGPAGATGAAGVAPPGYVAEILTQTATASSETTATSYGSLDSSSSLNVTVPANETDKLLVSFNAESTCYGGTAGARCMLRILVDNNEIAPAAGSDSYFDNNGVTGAVSTPSTQAQHAIVRISPTLTAGAHTVKVEVAVTAGTTTFRLDDWTLAVQRVRVT